MSLHLIIIIIIINQLDILNSSDVVLISFKSFFKYGSKTNMSSIDDLANTNLYSKINIGDPSYEIKAFLSVQHPYFSITPNHITKNINEFSSHYDITKSNSFKDITNSNRRKLFDSKYDGVAKEKFKLNIFNYKKKEHYNISIDDMIIIYNEDYNHNKINSYYLNIGFQIVNEKKYKEREQYNFIYQLKKRNIIQKYDWCLFFEKGKNNNGIFLYNPDELINAKGKLLIGDLPNNYNPNNFNENQLLTSYSKYENQIFKWNLEFSDIFYNKTSNDTIKIYIRDVHLNINNYIVLCPMTYYYNIKRDYFDFYLSKKLCHVHQGSEYKTFYCEKSENFNVENLKQFPILYMEHKEFQFTFEFTYEDLFIEKDNKYWFLVALSVYNNDMEEWFMGIIFLRKYNLIFNQDTKTISYYNINLPISTSKNNFGKILKYEKYINYFIIFIIILLVIIFGLYIIKKILKSKDKKRLNQEVDFDYINQDNYNKNEKINYGKSLLIEMKGFV